jgi:hypothetical protein
MTGTGVSVKASACASTDITLVVSVYTGSCGLLEFITFGAFECGDQASTEWLAETGEVYYILVIGASFDGGGTEVSFVLELESEFGPTPAPAPAPVTPPKPECNFFLLILAIIFKIITFGLVNLCG